MCMYICVFHTLTWRSRSLAWICSLEYAPGVLRESLEYPYKASRRSIEYIAAYLKKKKLLLIAHVDITYIHMS